MIPAVVRRLATLLSVSALLVAACCATASAAMPPRAVGLDEAAWEYAPDRADVGSAQGWAQGRGAANWEPVELPHVFDPHPDAGTFHGLVGWYRLPITAPRAAAGFGWGIRFEQVRRVAQVFLDGRLVATHADPYAPFTVPLPALGDGARHELVVRVDNRKGKEPREGWWNWGGITRPAQLVPLGALVTHDPGFLPRRICDETGAHCRWTVLVDAVVENRGTAVMTPQLRFALKSPSGAPAGAMTRTARPLAPGEQARVRFSVPVSGDPQLWGPGHPALYGASLQTLAAGRGAQQVDSARIGLRWVSVDHGLLELNGQPIELRGASIQEDVDGHGPALTDEDVAGIVDQLKTVGANVTRAHYALDERLQRRLDEAGILVWGQAPVYHRDELLKTEPQRQSALDTVRAAVLATRNHPSIITHSVANELSVIPDKVRTTGAFLRDARALTLDLDPTLPTSVDTLSYPGFPRQEAYAQFDLLGINSYFGWYPGKPGHSTANVRDLAPYLQGMRAMYPDTGLVLTEFGAESTMTGPADEKETYAFQSVYTRDVLGVVARQPTLSGAIYWTLREFAVKPHWDGGALREGVERDSIHNKGLITYDGRPKPAWDVLRQATRTTPLVRTDADVAHALGTRVADHDRGRIGAGLAIAILAAFLALLCVDLWAVLGWQTAIRGEREDAQAAALHLVEPEDEDADAERPRLRLVS